jgi:hypothetical protein
MQANGKPIDIFEKKIRLMRESTNDFPMILLLLLLLLLLLKSPALVEQSHPEHEFAD